MPTIFDMDLGRLLRSTSGRSGDRPQSNEQVLGAGPDTGLAPVSKVATSQSASTAGDLFPLVSILVRHEYANAQAGVFTGIELRPTTQTVARLALFGMIAQSRPDGVDIIWNTSRRDEASDRLDTLRPLIAAKAPEERAGTIAQLGAIFGEPLLFTATIADGRFCNFTAMPPFCKTGGPPLVLSNRSTGVPNGADISLLIPWPSSIEEAASEPAGTFEQVGTGYLRARVAEEARRRGDVSAPPAPMRFVHRTELDKLARTADCFALVAVHFAPDTAAAAPDWDPLPIDLSGLSDPTATGDWRYFRTRRYHIEFTARRTQWRYLVAARSGEIDRDSLEIVDAAGDSTRFALAAEPYTLPDARRAACLTSRTPLPILQRSTDHFTLRGIASGARRRTTLVRRLPAAGIDRLALGPTPAADSPGEPRAPPFCSDIHVFI